MLTPADKTVPGAPCIVTTMRGHSRSIVQITEVASMQELKLPPEEEATAKTATTEVVALHSVKDQGSE